MRSSRTPSRSEGTEPELDAFLRTAMRAADAASRVHRRYAGRVGVAEASEKGGSDFVSHVDHEAQDAVLDLIRREHPEHAILAEETDEDDDGDGVILPASGGGSGMSEGPRSRSEEDARAREVRDEGPIGEATPLWVVDPLDGTTNFLNHHPMYGASVAVWREGRPLAGAVTCSSTGERWWASSGRGAFKDGRRIRVSSLPSLSRALVGTGFPFKALEELPRYLGELDRVLRASGGVRRGGSAALDLCHLADGTFDAFWERMLKPWDVAAGILIVREAGGVVSRIDGSEIRLRDPDDPTVMGANSPELLAELGAVIRGLAD